MGTIFKSGIAYLGGGGGNANQEELTWDEYEALTEEEKTNGTVYYITDADEIEPDKFRPVIYSEDEREIGVWIDGKPLYQKTIPITSNFSASMTINHNITNLDTIISFNGIAALSSAFEPLNDEVGSEWRIRIGDFTFTTFSIALGTSRVNSVSKIFVNLCYTKTTDFPGSGKWTPQGVPALHYSTDEQVVGTWIDGKTLYEKTIEIGALPNNTTKNVAHGITDLKNIISVTGAANTSTYRITLPYVSVGSMVGVYVDSTNVVITSQSNVSQYADSYVIIRYTKTTS